MKTRKTMLSLMLLSAVCVSPAFANYFNDGRSGVMLNIGSAPSPTPEMLRRIGDTYYAPRPGRHMNTDVDVSLAPVAPSLMSMEGRMVFGARGERLGYVLGVDNTMQTIELQLPMGIAVSMPATLISNGKGRLIAPTTSRADVMAMAKEQTGRTVALNIDLRRRNTRG